MFVRRVDPDEISEKLCRGRILCGTTVVDGEQSAVIGLVDDDVGVLGELPLVFTGRREVVHTRHKTFHPQNRWYLIGCGFGHFRAI